MRLVTFDRGNGPRAGARVGESVVDLQAADAGLPASVKALLAGGPAMLRAAEQAAGAAPAGATFPLADVRLLPPVPDPGKIICLGLNYKDHAAEGGFEVPSYPAIFMRTASSMVGPHDPMIRPRVSEQLDYEAELAVIIGKPARHASEADALGHVAGYSCFNDGSIRKYQRLTAQWTIGKNFDSTGPFGPEIVTPDELPAGASGLRICSRLNGEVMQDSNTGQMIFTVANTIALMSECMTLEPGDVIIMGTPAGVGHARRPQVWMKDGDLCEVEIEGVGVLRNPIRDEAPAA